MPRKYARSLRSKKSIELDGKVFIVGECYACGGSAARGFMSKVISFLKGDRSIYLGDIICGKCFRNH